VDARSRIGAAERIYWSTLLDENAASHFAFGSKSSALLRMMSTALQTPVRRNGNAELSQR